MARVSQLPLQASNAHVLVGLRLNSRPARLIFDTGAYTSLLSEAAVDRLGLVHMRGEEIRNTLATVSGIGGARTARYVTAHNVELGGLHARDYNFTAADLPIDWADGLLSIDLVSQFDIDLDFPESKIVLYKPAGDCSTPAAFLSGPLYSVALEPTGQDRRPRVRVMVGHQVLVALIDTGAPQSSIFRTAARRLGIDVPRAVSGARHTGGIGPGQVASADIKLPELTVGDVVFGNMKVAVLDEAAGDDTDMLLGADFQTKVHLWISYSSHTLIMQYPPRASKQISSP